MAKPHKAAQAPPGIHFRAGGACAPAECRAGMQDRRLPILAGCAPALSHEHHGKAEMKKGSSKTLPPANMGQKNTGNSTKPRGKSRSCQKCCQGALAEDCSRKQDGHCVPRRFHCGQHTVRRMPRAGWRPVGRCAGNMKMHGRTQKRLRIRPDCGNAALT